MAGEKDFIVKNSLQIGGGALVFSKDADGDLEVKNSSGTLKTLKVDKIELGTGSDAILLEKDSNGKFKQSVKNKSTKSTTEAAPEFLIDEDNMASNSATKVPSQQSVKAYVDAQVQSKDALSELSGTSDDITEGSTNLFHTSERVDDRVAAFLTAGTGITLTHDDAGNSLTISGSAQYGDSDVLDYLSGGTYAGHIIPSADVTYDLGSLSKQWRDVYVGPGSLYVNGQKVLEDSSGTIIVSADSDQNLQMKTAGSGDIEFNPSGTGVIQAKGTFQMLDGKLITNSAGNNVAFGNNISVDQIASRSTDTNLVLSGNGTGNVTLNDDVVISGSLTVSGTTTTVNSETINLADNILNLNSDFTSGSPTQDAGISVSRGGSAAKTFLWDETNDRWTVGSETMVAGTFIGAVTGNVTGNVTGSSGSTTGNAATATALQTSRTIGLTGDVSGSGSFDGTGNLTITATIADDSHNHIIGNVDGLQAALDAKYGSGSNATLGTITTSNASNAGGYVRNIFQSTSTPGSGDGAVGDLWIYYS